jgi:hypothetical protein
MAHHGDRYHEHNNIPSSTPTLTPTPAARTFDALGTTFNDATRAAVGGLQQTATQNGGQSDSSILSYVNDLLTVQSGIQAEINAGQFTGDTLTHAHMILADLATAISAAQASVNGGGTFGSIAAAEAALRTSHLDILNIVVNDPNLIALATQNGAPGFMQAPQTVDGVAPQDAPRANSTEIGAIFNEADDNPVPGRASNDNITDVVQADDKMRPKAAFSKPASTTSREAEPATSAPR